MFAYFFIGKYKFYNNQKLFEEDKNKKEQDILNNINIKKSNDVNYRNNMISIYESDKYKDLYEKLPFEIYTNDNNCPDKYMDVSQILEINNLRKRNNVIY